VATMDFDSSKRGVSPDSAGEGYQLGCSSCAAPVAIYSVLEILQNLFSLIVFSTMTMSEKTRTALNYSYDNFCHNR
jgi:hypothetical protein